MFLDKIKPRRLIFLNIAFLLVCIKFYIDLKKLKKQLETSFCISEKPFPQDQAPNINIFDLNKKLEPSYLYDEIKCKESTLYDVRTNLCVHDLNKDQFVSRSIWQTGLWERSQLVIDRI